MRVSMSAIGSVICVNPCSTRVAGSRTPLGPLPRRNVSPAALDDPGHFAAQRHLAEAEPAQGKLAQVGARAAAPAAAIAVPNGILGLLVEVLDGLCSGCHRVAVLIRKRPLVLAEGNPDQLQEPPAFLVALRRRSEEH